MQTYKNNRTLATEDNYYLIVLEIRQEIPRKVFLEHFQFRSSDKTRKK